MGEHEHKLKKKKTHLGCYPGSAAVWPRLYILTTRRIRVRIRPHWHSRYKHSRWSRITTIMQASSIRTCKRVDMIPPERDLKVSRRQRVASCGRKDCWGGEETEKSSPVSCSLFLRFIYNLQLSESWNLRRKFLRILFENGQSNGPRCTFKHKKKGL